MKSYQLYESWQTKSIDPSYIWQSKNLGEKEEVCLLSIHYRREREKERNFGYKKSFKQVNNNKKLYNQLQY